MINTRETNLRLRQSKPAAFIATSWRRFVIYLMLLIMNLALLPKMAAAETCQYWIAPPPEGSNDHPGTKEQPWATLRHASATAPDNHCTIWVKDGLYSGENHLGERFTTTITFRAVNPYRAVLENDGMVINLNGVRNMVIEGFEIRHAGPGANVLVVKVDRAGDIWSEHVVFRNNIIHDSWNNDLFKLHNGARFVTIENNLFYNAGEFEHHLDVNSVTDVTIQDNIFFNDYAGSDRTDPANTKAFITIKDSNGASDGLEGNERITVQRNVFLNWEGGRETFVQIGNDGKPYHEAEDIAVVSNLMIGNAPNPVYAGVGIRGAKNVLFANNTIVGDLPASAYAFWVSLKEQNPKNENIAFYNNIWSDPTGTMGANQPGDANEFSNGDLDQTESLILDNNLYWNGEAPIPPGDLVSPLEYDPRPIIGDPLLNTDQTAVVLPRWDGAAFASGNGLIREEFIRLAETYGAIPVESPAIGAADPAFAPEYDLLGRIRTATPEIGAYEYEMALTGSVDYRTIELQWTDPAESQASHFSIAYAGFMNSGLITDIPIENRSYTLADLPWSTTYSITLMAKDAEGRVLAQTTPLTLAMDCGCVYVPLVFRRHGSEQPAK